MTTEQHNFHETYVKRVDDHKLTLKGDGSSIPSLRLEGDAYVSSKDLRAMAKQLKKWAKALESIEV